MFVLWNPDVEILCFIHQSIRMGFSNSTQALMSTTTCRDCLLTFIFDTVVSACINTLHVLSRIGTYYMMHVNKDVCHYASSMHSHGTYMHTMWTYCDGRHDGCVGWMTTTSRQLIVPVCSSMNTRNPRQHCRFTGNSIPIFFLWYPDIISWYTESLVPQPILDDWRLSY